MDGNDVRAATRAMTDALSPHTERDWTVPAGGLDWSCRRTLAHIAHDVLAYAGQVVAGPPDGYLPFDAVVAADAAPARVLAVATAAGHLLARALDGARPADRAWHFGPTDPTGFAALGAAEILLHTTDITSGLTEPFPSRPAPSREALPRQSPPMPPAQPPWRPPAQLCSSILARLFPTAPPGDPVEVLLWCTGRTDLPNRPHQTDWVWKAARP